MTKDELEKERFVKSYPEFCYNGKPLGTYLNNEDVIAWKEIVLPELKENG